MSLAERGHETLANSRRWFSDWAPGSMDEIVHQGMGVAGEAGEVIEWVKKYHRRSISLNTLIEEVAPELADVLTYVLNLAAILGIDLDDELVRKQAECEERWGGDD